MKQQSWTQQTVEHIIPDAVQSSSEGNNVRSLTKKWAASDYKCIFNLKERISTPMSPSKRSISALQLVLIELFGVSSTCCVWRKKNEWCDSYNIINNKNVGPEPPSATILKMVMDVWPESLTQRFVFTMFWSLIFCTLYFLVSKLVFDPVHVFLSPRLVFLIGCVSQMLPSCI